MSEMSWLRVHKSIVRGALLALVALGILAGSGVVQPGQASAQGSTGLHRAIKNANIRNKPSKNSVVLTTAPKYAIVAAVGPTKGCGAHSCAWVKVSYDGVEGWSKGAYFEPALLVEGTAVANVNLNLRATPGYDGQVLAVIPADGELTLTGRQSYPWVSVTYNGKKGWVYSEFLTVYPPPQY
jgi:zinc D-Ala-D-Ala carboxypeptidase